MGDRGLMKWSAFMMPEHHSMLKKWKIEALHEDRVLLSEEQQLDLNQKMMEAIGTQKQLLLKYYDERNRINRFIHCQIVKWDAFHGAFQIRSVEDAIPKKIAAQDIVDIRFI